MKQGLGFKGFNSILFDFDSLIDIELSLISYIKETYDASDNLKYINLDRILDTDIHQLISDSQFGDEDLFKSLLVSEDHKKQYKEIMFSLIKAHEQNIYKFFIKTDITSLYNGYIKTGGGTIKTTILCENNIQRSVMQNMYPQSNIIVCERKDVDMSNYGRLVVGTIDHALEYELEEPKSILILNYRDNFVDKNCTQLKPELIIKFGDIHDINVAQAYRLDAPVTM